MSNPIVTTPTALVTVPQLTQDPDYSQFQFRPERVVYHGVFAAGLQWLQGRAKSDRVVDIGTVKICPNGQITIGPTTFDATKWAFEELCARLGIPCPFAQKIPPDLLLHTITRLIQEAAVGGGTSIQFHFSSYSGQDVIIGCTKEGYQFVEATDFLTAVAAMDGNGYTLHDLIYTDRLIDVDLQIDNQVITTTAGPKYKVLINLRSSDCGDVNPTARLGLFDTQGGTCVLSTEWGRVDRIRNKKMSIETTFASFMGKVVEMIVPGTQLQASLNTANTKCPTDLEVKNYYGTFNRAIDNKDTIDSLLGWTEDERKAIFKDITVRKKNNALNKLQGLTIVPDPVLNFTQRQLAGFATDYAKNAVIEEREALRRLGGSFISLG